MRLQDHEALTAEMRNAQTNSGNQKMRDNLRNLAVDRRIVDVKGIRYSYMDWI
jgi:hypothetical protein